jgi:SdpI/YfhL protein family
MYVVILIVAIMDAITGLVFLGFLRPLVQRKIGRNGFYGFRTPKTLASDKAWYAVNHGAAKAGVYMSIGMVIFGIVAALFGIVLALLPSTMSDYMEDTVLFAAVAAPGVLIIGLMVAMNIELKKLGTDSLADPEEML